MRTRLASLVAAAALTVAVVAMAAPASADTVPGSPNQFYAYCSVDLFGTPVACTETSVAQASHICEYVVTGVGLSLDCIVR